MELENLLKQEAKSRNKAEKKLKFLMKKLESMDVETEQSRSGDKSDISSLSSTTSSSSRENQQMKIESQEPKENAKFQKGQNDSQNCLLSLSDDSSISAFEVNLQEIKEGNIAQNATFDDSLSSASDAHSEKSSHLGSSRCYNDSKMDEQSDVYNPSVKSSQEGLNQEGDQDLDHHIDNSMALVPFDRPQKNQTVDPDVLDATVKQVLESLRRAKEQLQNSMERRRMNMIKVG
ncbi:hypothetical protein CDL12_19388 [Handroanthus impetiginosus]|uniref:Uncharacterized protein n=1 Tax=Handroanthus impetiginosus TaxID=429701 RepID=A0A2G9GRX9_9LAMI|nr:hypothetical protein CDL12_19388 [Handroanthus impetiginosus]